jgi:hypothetical protein
MENTNKNVRESLSAVQVALKAKKDMENKFGGYKYRNKEGIFEAVKPLLDKEGATIVVVDDIVSVADRVYVKSTATYSINGCQDSISATGFAREPLSKKGMDEAQITGSSSSYAGKYALCNLLAIDDSADDPDSTNDHGKRLPTMEEVASIVTATNTDELRVIYSKLSMAGVAVGYVKELCQARKAQLETAA